MNEITMSVRKNILELNQQEKADLLKGAYAKSSRFQQLFHADSIELNCKEYSNAFRAEIERLLLEKKLIHAAVKLEDLHTVLSDEQKAYNFNDGVNKVSSHFYETDEKFSHFYHQFIVKFLRQHFFKEPFYFQATPTIRIHCPNGENSHHYPRYHTDITYGHPPQEINLWLPLTEVQEGHGFRVMRVERSKQILQDLNFEAERFIDQAINDKQFSAYCEHNASPVTTEFGSVLAFDSRCIHSGEPLKRHTRISIDVRIIPVADYHQMELEYQGSGRRKTLFAPGHCYHASDSDHIL